MVEGKERRKSRYKIPMRVVLKAIDQYGVDIKSLIYMVGRSAKVTHNQGNRRYHNWLFDVRGGEVVSVHSLQEETHTIKNNTQEKDILIVSNYEKKTYTEQKEVTKYYLCDMCQDTGRVQVFDDCDFCEGVGCSKCNNTGEIKRYIPCQECKKREMFKK